MKIVDFLCKLCYITVVLILQVQEGKRYNYCICKKKLKVKKKRDNLITNVECTTGCVSAEKKGATKWTQMVFQHAKEWL